jgi:hypothetical protein
VKLKHFNFLVAVALGALRLLGCKTLAFQAVAHFFVCGLFMTWHYKRLNWCLGLGLALTVLETMAFLYSKGFLP